MPKMKKPKRPQPNASRRRAAVCSNAAKAFKSHILEKKSPKRIRQLRKAVMVSKSDQKRVERMLPNG